MDTKDLERSERRFRALVEASAQLVVITDPAGEVTGSERWTEFTGQSFDEMKGRGWLAAVHPDDLPELGMRVQQALVSTSVLDVDYRLRRRDGEYRWMTARFVPIFDAGGTLVEWVGMEADVTEQKALLRERAEAERRKDEFLALLAHELRNPLAPIRNLATALQRAPSIPAAIADAGRMIDRQVDQLSHLIDDLLDVSRLTRGTIALQLGPVDLGEVARLAVETIRPQCAERMQVLEVALGDAPVPVSGDAVRLSQVLGNLLSNASKFTPEGGRISVRGGAEEGTAVVRVSDTGIGIDAPDLSRIFEMFTQVDASVERGRGGLGIGLSLARNLVQMHGGSLEASSAGRDRGSEFVLRLPLGAPLPASESGSPGGADVAPQKVLVVDDNADAAQSLAMLLELEGHLVSIAYDGASALQVAERFRPAVVLLDIGLPGLNGYDVAKALRREPWAGALRIVALTGWGKPEDRARSKQAGFDGHLVKPLVYADLLALLAGERAAAGS